MCLPRVCLLLSLFLPDTPQWCRVGSELERPPPAEHPALILIGGGGGQKPRDPSQPGPSQQGDDGGTPAPFQIPNPAFWSYTLCNIGGRQQGHPRFDYDTFCGCTSDAECQQIMSTTEGTSLHRPIDLTYAHQYACVECDPCRRQHAMDPAARPSPLGCKLLTSTTHFGRAFEMEVDPQCNIWPASIRIRYLNLPMSAIDNFCQMQEMRDAALIEQQHRDVGRLLFQSLTEGSTTTVEPSTEGYFGRRGDRDDDFGGDPMMGPDPNRGFRPPKPPPPGSAGSGWTVS